MSRDSHALSPDSSTDPCCPEWCVGRRGLPHDVDDLYGVMGVHHDSDPAVLHLPGPDEQSDSYVTVKASQLVPTAGEPWPARVEVDADITKVRRLERTGAWLHAEEATDLAEALMAAAALAAATNQGSGS